MKTKKGPKFVKRDDEKIKAYEDNGGLSESTKLARKSAIKVFNDCQEINERPKLDEICTELMAALNKFGSESTEVKNILGLLEKDIQGFFQSYYVQLAPESVEKDEISEETETTDQDVENKENVSKENLRPKRNTADSKKSHLKMTILGLTRQRFDITNPGQFSTLNVSFCIN